MQHMFDEEGPSRQEVSIKGVLSDVLIKEFIDNRLEKGNRWPESDADRLRDVLNSAEANSIGSVLKESELYRRWSEINERRFSSDDIALVGKFEKFLFSFDELLPHSALYFSLKESLYQLKEDRMRALGVSIHAINEDRAHTSAVEANCPEGLGKIMAILHDVSKYSAKKDTQDNLVQVRNIGIHEATSAVLAGDILREAFLSPKVIEWLDEIYGDVYHAYGYQDMAEHAIKFMETSIAAHGHMEFPMKVSRNRAIEGVDGAFIYQPAPIMPKEVYLGKYVALDRRFEGDTSSDEFKRALLLFEGLREADMMVGVDPWSFVKYFNEAPPNRVFDFRTASGYIHSFAPTAVEYLRDAPDVLHLRQSSRIEDVNNKVGVIFTLMHATEVMTPEGFRKMVDELSTDMGDDYTAAEFKGVCAEALDIHESFNTYKLLMSKDGADPELAPVLKKALAKSFSVMVDKLMKFSRSKLQASRLMPAVKARVERIEAELEYNSADKASKDAFIASIGN